MCPLEGAKLVLKELALFEGVLVVLSKLVLLAEDFVSVVAAKELQSVGKARFGFTRGLCVIFIVLDRC